MSTTHRAEDLIAGLGIELTLQDNQQITDVLVIARVADFSERGGTALTMGVSPGVDWLLQWGMIKGADAVMASPEEDAPPGAA